MSDYSKQGISTKIKNRGNDIVEFIFALWPNTAGFITGGSIAAVIAVFYAFGGTLPTWSLWTLLALAFFASAFKAWKEKVKALEEQFQMHIEANQKHASEQEKIISFHAREVRANESTINSLQTHFDDREHKKLIKDTLGLYLSDLELRIACLKRTDWYKFDQSVFDKEYDDYSPRLVELKEFLAKHLSRAELAYCEGMSDMVKTPVPDAGIMRDRMERYHWFLDVLTHRASKLKAIIEKKI